MGALELADKDFWANPTPALERFNTKRTLSRQLGLVIDLPGSVPVGERKTLPLLGSATLSLRDGASIDFARSALLVAVNAGDGAARVAFLKAQDRLPRPAAPSAEDPGEGWATVGLQAELRDRLSLPWEPGAWDVLVHLAFLVTERTEQGDYEAINVGGSKNAISTAARAGVGQVVYLSSVASYGHQPGSGELVTESTPRRRNDEFSYAATKYDVEAWLDEEFEPRYPEVAVARLTMRDFSEGFLDAYLDTAGNSVLASVGAYQLERYGIHLFERIEGDHFTILGLPLLPLLGFLRREGALAG